MADADNDEVGALARSMGACCLKTLADIAERDEDPALRAYAWKELQRHLLQLRRFLADPRKPADARADVEATLRGFWDS